MLQGFLTQNGVQKVRHMAWKEGKWLKALAKDPGSVPRTQGQLTNVCNSDAFFGPLWVPDMHVVDRHSCKHLNT